MIYNLDFKIKLFSRFIAIAHEELLAVSHREAAIFCVNDLQKN